MQVINRVVLLKVEQATCKKSQLTWAAWAWAVCMQADQFQLISYLIIAAGQPAALYHSWTSSWRVKQGNRIVSEDVQAILLN